MDVEFLLVAQSFVYILVIVSATSSRYVDLSVM